MNPRLWVTAGLIPLAALGMALAPLLSKPAPAPAPSTPAVPTPEAPTPQTPEVPTHAEVAQGRVHLTAAPDREVVYAGDRALRVKVDLWADPGEVREIPTDLVVVVDRSGSMGGDKILDARAAAQELVSQLGPQDRFGLVSFDDTARVDVALGVTKRAAWSGAIERLVPGGSTNLAQGLSLGLSQVSAVPGRARRVVVISDGRPDSAVGLDDLASRATRSETPLTAIGIGADYDEALMQRLADGGAGNFYWVTRGPELGQALAAELSTARETVGNGVSLSLAGAELVEAGGVPATGGHVALGTLYAGQHRTVWLTVRVPAGSTGSFDLGSLVAAWHDPQGATASVHADLPRVGVVADPKLAWGNLGDKWADALVNDGYNDLRTRVSAAVQAGDQAGALAAIDQYDQDNKAINAYAQNAAVTDNLAELQQLRQDVNGNFVGEDQAQRQNLWAKGTRVDSYGKRRAGQMRSAP